jgi:predicted nucleotidyltransferase
MSSWVVESLGDLLYLGQRSPTVDNGRITVPTEKIEEFCRRWKIMEFALFGSALREDFRSDSDVDVLVSFAKDADWDLFDWVNMVEELKGIFGREVDLVEKTSLRNPFRRHYILNNQRIIYAT